MDNENVRDEENNTENGENFDISSEELLEKLKEAVRSAYDPEKDGDVNFDEPENPDYVEVPEEEEETPESEQPEEKKPGSEGIKYHFTVRKPIEKAAIEAVEEEKAKEEIPEVKLGIDTDIKLEETGAPGASEVMEEILSAEDRENLEKFASMPTSEEIKEMVKEKTDEEEEKPSFVLDENGEENAKAFIESLTQKAKQESEERKETAEETEKVEGAGDNKGAEFDDVDVNLMLSFGMDEELEEKLGKEKAQQILDEAKEDAKNFTNTDVFKVAENEMPVEEYTDPSQTKDIFREYKKKHRKAFIKMIAAAFLFVFLFFVENFPIFGISLPGGLNPGIYPVVSLMVGLQCLVFLAALAWPNIKEGVNALLAQTPTTGSAIVVLLAMAVIYELLTLAFSRDNICTYNFAVAFAVLLELVGTFLDIKRELYTFDVVASKKVKFALERVPSEKNVEEREAFAYFFGEDLSDLNETEEEGEEEGEKEPVKLGEHETYGLKKAGFIDGFFESIGRYPMYKSILKFIIPLFAGISLLLAIVGLIRTGTLSGGIRLGYLALVLATPMSLFVSFSYAAFKASKDSFNSDSAIIGEAAPEMYFDTSIMTFEDKDIFPTKGVKVKSIKVYGDNRIDRVVFLAANIFRKYGGPLSQVFNKVTLELGITDDVYFGTIEDDGIEAMVSGKHIYIGKTDYIRRKGYEPAIEDEDEVIEGTGGICIMYMAIEDELASKFYVEYTVDPEFEALLRALYTSGICVAIRTYDPNIDDKMLELLLRYEQYPVKVIKTRSEEGTNIAREHAKTGVVSRRSAKDMLRAFMNCDRMLRAVRGSTVLKLAAMAVGAILTLVFIIAASTTAIASFYALLFQVFWLIPILLLIKIIA